MILDEHSDLLTERKVLLTEGMFKDVAMLIIISWNHCLLLNV
ncbi:MAG: hypothetical protein WBN17_01165 [Aureibaculum sp.]